MQQTVSELFVRQEGQFLEVTPAGEGLKQVLQSPVHVPSVDAQGCLGVGKVPSQLYRERATEEGPVLDCFAGLLPVILRFAERAGYAPRVQGPPVDQLPEPDVRSVERLAPLDVNFLRCVRQHDRALMRCEPSVVDPARLVAQVALAWPQLTVAVAVTRIDEARQVRDRLRRYLPGVVAVTSRSQVPDSEVGRVVVATYNGLGHTGIEVEKRDVLLALNAVEASRPNALACLGHAKRARVYGLLAASESVAPFDQDALRLLFGFEEVEVPAQGTPTVRDEVVWWPKVGCPALSTSMDVVEVKRRGLWRNHARNRLVARLAHRLQAGDWQVVEKDSPAAAAGLADRSRPNVAVLVENVEHAEALATYLPGWSLAANNVRNAGCAGQIVNGTHGSPAADSDHSPGVIATALGVGNLDRTGLDVLLRADGGLGLPPLPPFPSGEIVLRENNLPVTPSGEQRLLLVDFVDRHHPLLRRWGRQRRAAYADRGWYAPGVEPVQEQVERFLAGRS
jgi:hypothetical protein